MAFVKFYYTQNISKNEEDVLSYPKVVIEEKKKHSRQITALSLRIFTRISMSTKCFTRSRGAQFEHMNFLKLKSYLVKYKSLLLHAVNKPSTEPL